MHLDFNNVEISALHLIRLEMLGFLDYTLGIHILHLKVSKLSLNENL